MITLIEGYTEWRTRQVLARMLRDGMAGREGPARKVARAFAHRRQTLEQAQERLDAFLEPHPYTPYVRLIEGIRALEGGVEALEHLVRRGAVEPLAAVLGREKLVTMAALAETSAGAGQGFSPKESDFPGPRELHVSQRLGLPGWLDKQLVNVLDGKLSLAEVGRIRSRASWLIRELARSLEGKRGSVSSRLASLPEVSFDEILASRRPEALARAPRRDRGGTLPFGILAGVAGAVLAFIAQLGPAAVLLLVAGAVTGAVWLAARAFLLFWRILAAWWNPALRLRELLRYWK